jgi:hypothetical protein
MSKIQSQNTQHKKKENNVIHSPDKKKLEFVLSLEKKKKLQKTESKTSKINGLLVKPQIPNYQSCRTLVVYCNFYILCR